MGRASEFKEASGGPRVGDRVDLGGGVMGQLWSAAPGPNQWHAVDENGNAHFYNAKTQTARPANDPQGELAKHRFALSQKYDLRGRGTFNPMTARGRSLTVGQKDISELKRAAGVKAPRARKAS